MQVPRIYQKTPVTRVSNSPAPVIRRVSNRVSNPPQQVIQRVSNSPSNVIRRVSNRVSSNVNGSGVRNSANITYGQPRKSQTRFYRLDKDGNKTYVDQMEQSRLEEKDANEGANGTRNGVSNQ